MLTIEKIKTEFTYQKAWTGDSEVFHDTVVFEDHGKFCDLYFQSINKKIKQEQVDVYNLFRKNYSNYLDEIEQFINDSFIRFGEGNLKKIKKSVLLFDVLDIPFDNFKYDLVLVCGITYKRFLFLKTDLNIKIEFKKGRIKSIQRKKDTTIDNA